LQLIKRGHKTKKYEKKETFVSRHYQIKSMGSHHERRSLLKKAYFSMPLDPPASAATKMQTWK
jgi:hypothetical protein